MCMCLNLHLPTTPPRLRVFRRRTPIRHPILPSLSLFTILATPLLATVGTRRQSEIFRNRKHARPSRVAVVSVQLHAGTTFRWGGRRRRRTTVGSGGSRDTRHGGERATGFDQGAGEAAEEWDDEWQVGGDDGDKSFADSPGAGGLGGPDGILLLWLRWFGREGFGPSGR